MFRRIKFIGVYDYTVILTYISLFSSVLGMLKATQGKFNCAVLCLVISGICDAFDGIVARSKKNRTEIEKEFGIQIDSLCDVICFGVFPGFLGYSMGVDGIVGKLIVFSYCLCAVIRLAYFNVLESNRQKEEDGCAKAYRGLPVTSIAVIFPIVYGIHFFVSEVMFIVLLHIMLLGTALLFILDFSVPKPDWTKIYKRSR